MKKIAFLTCILFFYSSPLLFAQSSSVRQKALILKRVIELNHYSPRPVNDSFSLSVFKTIISNTDSRRLFFTAAEYKQLSAYSLKIDNELNGTDWAFFDQLTLLYKKALKRADSIVTISLQKPFNFSTNETVTISTEESFNFAASIEELNNRWARYLKLVACRNLYSTTHSDSSVGTSATINFSKTEPLIRNKIKKTEINFIQHMLEYKTGFDNYIAEIYLDAVASAFDPHTNYFSQEGKETFQSALSSEAYSFGIELDENQKGQIVIKHLQPGGPAWKSGEMHDGDELLQIQPEGKEPIDMTGQSVVDAYEIITAAGHEKMSFKIRKNNGQENVIALRKEKINNEENVVESFVLNGAHKVGYILLPGFYTEWGNEGGSSCASDVAKEIIKLKREKIEGLILDVRYNGGGSVGEALEMAGIFIDEGPLAGEKDRSGKLVFFKDPNRGVIYSGPMILLVNGQSASASELLAASLQDYNRAVIAGSRTFGKATMQDMFFLDTTTKKSAAQNTLTDVLKITIAKIYRLNGQSAQFYGITPDVQIPDEFEQSKIAEKYYPNALPPDTVKKNAYYKPLPLLPINELAVKSAQRIDNNKNFQTIKKANSLHPVKENTEVIPLKWESFEKWANEKEKQFSAETDIQDKPSFTVSNHEQNRQWLETNKEDKDWNDAMIKNIGEDIYLQETFLILCDLINLQKTIQ